jgi:hypothetical protein
MAAVAAFCNVGTTVMGSFDAGVTAKVQHCFQAFISPQELRLGIKNYFVFLIRVLSPWLLCSCRLFAAFSVKRTGVSVKFIYKYC